MSPTIPMVFPWLGCLTVSWLIVYPLWLTTVWHPGSWISRDFPEFVSMVQLPSDCCALTEGLYGRIPFRCFRHFSSRRKLLIIECQMSTLGETPIF